MSEEIFDVVDANDQVIGQQPRSEVHRLGLRHRAIHLLVFNAQGELFLQKRSMKKDACEATGQEFVWVYRCEHEGPFQLDPDELSDGGWFAPKKITDWIAATSEDFAPAFVLIWQLLRDK